MNFDEAEEIVTDIQEEIDLELLKIQACINIAKIDFEMYEDEVTFLSDLIEESELEDDTKMELIQSLHTKEITNIDFSSIKGNDLYALTLIENLATLIKLDGIAKSAEKIYFFKIARELGFEKDDVKELIEIENEIPTVI